MASTNTNKTILAVGVVAIAAYVAYKALPKLLKKMTGSNGSGGSGGAAGASYYAPYNPDYPQSSQSSGPSLGAQLGLPGLPGGSKAGMLASTSGLTAAGKNQYMNVQQATNMVNADLASGAYSMPLASLDSWNTPEQVNGQWETVENQWDADQAASATMPGPTGNTSTGFGDLSAWLNKALGFDNAPTQNNGLDEGLIPYQQVQQYDLNQVQQSVNAGDQAAVDAGVNALAYADQGSFAGYDSYPSGDSGDDGGNNGGDNSEANEQGDNY
jgi:hypothetical protein